tara:strand:- start:1216 stop:1758 length:543 start_codon:yes stop_codon:yes gene_type:complete
MENYLNNYYKKLTDLVKIIDTKKLKSVEKLVNKTKKNNNKVIIVGNGGSAAIASHVSVDFTKVAKVRCINFNEADLLTCFSNDYGYENWVSNALNFYADQNDLVILISSSGKSKNILNGAKMAKKKKCKVITFSGFKKQNPLSKLGNYNFWVDSRNYNIVENVHQVWLLSLVDKIAKTKI